MDYEYITVFVTCGTSDEARHIGKMLVHENLAACANALAHLAHQIQMMSLLTAIKCR